MANHGEDRIVEASFDPESIVFKAKAYADSEDEIRRGLQSMALAMSDDDLWAKLEQKIIHGPEWRA